MTDEVTALQKRYTLVGTKAQRPSSGQFDGQQYYATDEDTAYYWDAGDSSWVSTSAAPDGTTIKKNGSGQLARYGGKRVGTFNTDFGNWTKEDGGGGVSRNSNHAHEGSHSVQCNDYGSGTGQFMGISRTFDMTDRDEFVAYFKVVTSGNHYYVLQAGGSYGGDTGAPAIVMEKLSTIGTGSWAKVTLDVSGLSGNYKVYAGLEDNSSDTGQLQVDDIRSPGKSSYYETGSGSGG